MRHPQSLQRAIVHPPGERLVSRPGPSSRPADAREDGRGPRSATGQVLVATGSLLAATAATFLIIGLPGAPGFFVVGLLLVIAGTALQRPRLAGRALAALVCVLLLPALLAIGLAVKLTSQGPVLIRRDDTDRDDPTAALRFRTTLRGPKAGCRTITDTRPTPIGRVLHRLGLDELPSLLDVVVGERPHHPTVSR